MKNQVTDFDSLEYFKEWCELATLAQLREQERAAVWMLSETDSPVLRERARSELAIIRKNIREIES